MPTQTFAVGVPQNIQLNTFTKSGYIFGGWSESEYSSSAEYSDGEEYTLYNANVASLTFYAVWDCETCNGEGVLYEECPRCATRGTNGCSYCEYTGQIEEDCPDCD